MPDRQPCLACAHEDAVDVEARRIAECFELRGGFFEFHGNRCRAKSIDVNQISTKIEIGGCRIQSQSIMAYSAETRPAGLGATGALQLRAPMTSEGTTVVLGIPIPSIDPVFLAVVGVHVLFGIAAVIAGAVAMLSRKRRGRHSKFGTVYFWCLFGVFFTMSALSFMRWAENVSAVRPGSGFFCRRISRAQRCSAAMAAMAEAASHRHGCLLYCPAYRVLRGQRQELATVEGASANCILVAAWRYRSTANRPCPVSAQAGPRLRSHANASYAMCGLGVRQQRPLSQARLSFLARARQLPAMLAIAQQEQNARSEAASLSDQARIRGQQRDAARHRHRHQAGR